VLISGFRGRQPAGDVSHKLISRPPLSARPAVIFPASEHYRPWPVPIYTDWKLMHVNDLSGVAA